MPRETIDKEVIIRFLEDKYSPADADLFLEYIRSPGSKTELESQLKRTWKSEGENPDQEADFERILNALHKSILEKELNREKRILQTRKTVRKVLHPALRMFTRAAAVLFIPLLIYTLARSKNEPEGISVAQDVYAEMTVPAGTTSKINLPDGSMVWLNSGSRLRYPTEFRGQAREVHLSGEGYFEVARQETNPFIVHSGDIGVKVLGTKFNVEAYEDQDFIRTTLVVGSVALSRVAAQNQRKELTTLEPGELLYFDKTSKASVLHKDVDTYKYTSWIDGITVFKNDPLNEVFDRLSRRYNVNIEYTESEVSKYSFTATFEDENFDQVLELILLAIPLKYTTEKSSMQQDNSYSKKTYMISMR